MHLPLLRREPAVRRKHPGDVRRVVLEVRCVVVQHEIAIPELRLRRVVVGPRGILARRDETEMRHALRVVLLEEVVADRFQLVYIHRAARSVSFPDRQPGDARRFANERNLTGALDQAHGVEHRVEVSDDRWLDG